MEQILQQLAANPEEDSRLAILAQLAQLVMPLPLGLNLWKVENTFWEMLQNVLPHFRKCAVGGDEKAQAWITDFTALGKTLGFATRHLETAAPAELAA
jgi:hypothetical protein